MLSWWFSPLLVYCCFLVFICVFSFHVGEIHRVVFSYTLILPSLNRIQLDIKRIVSFSLNVGEIHRVGDVLYIRSPLCFLPRRGLVNSCRGELQERRYFVNSRSPTVICAFPGFMHFDDFAYWGPLADVCYIIGVADPLYYIYIV